MYARVRLKYPDVRNTVESGPASVSRRWRFNETDTALIFLARSSVSSLIVKINRLINTFDNNKCNERFVSFLPLVIPRSQLAALQAAHFHFSLCITGRSSVRVVRGPCLL